MIKYTNFFRNKQNIPKYIPKDLQELYVLANDSWRQRFVDRAKKIPESQQQFESVAWMWQIADPPSLKSRAGRIFDEQTFFRAQQGDVDCQLDWAKKNMNGQLIGRIGRRDYIEAKKWLEIAAGSGNAEAFYWLGQIYDNGNKAIPRDLEKAATYYEKAVELGDKDGIAALDRIKKNL